VSAGLARRCRRQAGGSQAAGPWLHPQLRRVLREVLEQVRGQRRRDPLRTPALHPARAASVRLGAHAARGDRLAAAERELEGVHRAELAYLLREASRLRRAPRAVHRQQDAALRACRDGLAEALACARSDALRLDARWCGLVRACIDAAVPDWPQASTLARVSLEVEPCAEGRVELARALLVAEDASAAEAAEAGSALAAALLACPSARRGADLLDELAALEERLGRPRRARSLRDWAARTREVA
jgi:hypothetical protein